MDVMKIAAELSEIERQALRVLGSDWQGIEQIANVGNINVDSVRRAVNWLREKKLAEIEEKKTVLLGLSKEGEEVVGKGLAEKRLLKALQELGGRAGLGEVEKKAGLKEKELNIALGLAKRNAWVSLHNEKGLVLELTGLEKGFLEKESDEESLIEKLGNGELKGNELSGKEKKLVEVLLNRGLISGKDVFSRRVKLNEQGEKVKGALSEVKVRAYNIQGAVPRIFIGKKQPYIQFLEQIRRKLIELGFKEMYSPLIVPEFYNFDVLFQPQNHPARTWSDTYQLKKPTHGKLPHPKVVKAVRDAHETGGVSASSGWGYSWSEIIASRLMPSAHATAHSARQLVKGIEIPGKYFSIARCYRPDIVDASHLIEFNQMDGFIVGNDLTFRNLLGVLKQFAIEVAGAEKVRFYPDYYPFTEPSVQLSAKHPELGWIEFAGAGMFRPEMMENLGVKEPAIAWGLGIDRLAMFKLGIKDIRYLFSDDLNWLRNSKMVE